MGVAMADTPTKKVSDSARRKPPAAGKGRPKGATNKMTRTIKAAIEEAFKKVGGADYLARMADEQPAAFMTLLGKVLPTQLEHSNPDGSMRQITQIKIVGVKPVDKNENTSQDKV